MTQDDYEKEKEQKQEKDPRRFSVRGPSWPACPRRAWEMGCARGDFGHVGRASLQCVGGDRGNTLSLVLPAHIWRWVQARRASECIRCRRRSRSSAPAVTTGPHSLALVWAASASITVDLCSRSARSVRRSHNQPIGAFEGCTAFRVFSSKIARRCRRLQAPFTRARR